MGLALSTAGYGGRPEQRSYKKALNDLDMDKWKMEMDGEMGSLHKNETFSTLKKPEKKKIIGC